MSVGLAQVRQTSQTWTQSFQGILHVAGQPRRGEKFTSTGWAEKW